MVRNISKISIYASLQKVWDTITTPEGVKQWQYGSELYTSREVGSPIKFVPAWDGKTLLEIIQEDSRPNTVQEKEQGKENLILSKLK